MKVRFFAMTAVALASVLDCAAGQVFRCRVPGGSISYQELPCAPLSDAGTVQMPSSFPEVNTEARERLLERETALDRRLEAERERLSREEMTRISARAQVAAAQAAAPAVEPAYVVAGWPIVMARPPFGARRIHPRGLLR